MLELDQLVWLASKKRRQRWFGHVECKDDAKWDTYYMKMEAEESGIVRERLGKKVKLAHLK